MRADNTRHIIDAARQRHELTRAKAIQALRTLDAAGTPSHSRPSPARRWYPGHGYMPSQISAPRSSGSGQLPAVPPYWPSRPSNGPPTPRCAAGWKPRSSGTAP